MLRVDRLEQLAVGADVLGRTQKQKTSHLQSVVQYRQDALLQRIIQVDEQIPATDQVEVAKRGVRDHVVAGEDAQFPHQLADLVAAFLADEETPQALG